MYGRAGRGLRIPVGMPTTRGGGIGIGALLVILVLGWFLGINPLSLIGGSSSDLPISFGDSEPGELDAPSDEAGRFVAVVLADTEETWTKIFAQGGARYRVPTLVLFSGETSSACGYASAASGPFYCPGDAKVYIDLAFYRELRNRFSAPGDFAQAYVIAHEVGHHVQNLLGTLRPGTQPGANSDAVRTELQADCFAGIWAHVAEANGILEVGDIDEALNAAAQIGDDTLQRRSQGYVVPESFTHGTAEQRSRWFKRGYQRGDLEACDTFAATAL